MEKASSSPNYTVLRAQSDSIWCHKLLNLLGEVTWLFRCYVPSILLVSQCREFIIAMACRAWSISNYGIQSTNTTASFPILDDFILPTAQKPRSLDSGSRLPWPGPCYSVLLYRASLSPDSMLCQCSTVGNSPSNTAPPPTSHTGLLPTQSCPFADALLSALSAFSSFLLGSYSSSKICSAITSSRKASLLPQFESRVSCLSRIL